MLSGPLEKNSNPSLHNPCLQQGQSARGVLLYLHIVFRETSLTPLV